MAQGRFNSRAHGGRDGDVRLVFRIVAFQFTRPRGARLARARHGRADLDVSIHAPTGGATRAVVRVLDFLPVSIHAPTGGATFAPR